MAEILSTKQPEGETSYNLIEVTSSGLTHTHHRVIPGFEFLTEKATEILMNTEYLVSRFFDYNYGTIEFV